MTRWSAITRTRGRRSALAYGSRSTTAAEDNLNPVVHHERGRYFGSRCQARPRFQGASRRIGAAPSQSFDVTESTALCVSQLFRKTRRGPASKGLVLPARHSHLRRRHVEGAARTKYGRTSARRRVRRADYTETKQPSSPSEQTALASLCADAAGEAVWGAKISVLPANR
jgi:hypothetical protein